MDDENKFLPLERFFWRPRWRNLSRKKRMELLQEEARDRHRPRRNTGELIKDVNNVNQTDTRSVATSQLELIHRYHHNVLKQAQQSFFWALVAALSGILLLFAAIITFLL